MSAALRIDGVGYRYGGAQKEALSDVSCTVAAGSFTALLGANGAGKSTLVSLVTRLFETASGRIEIAGHALTQSPRQAMAALGVVFQQPTLDLDLTVTQNLRYFAALQGIGKREADARLERELTRLQMFERRGEKVRRLNGGHRRRVEIARALLHRPRLLLLDEPTVGLDVPTRATIVDHVHALAAEENIGVLWATHLIDEIRPTDAVVMLHAGTIRAQGAVPDVVEQFGAADLSGAFQQVLAGDAP
ncbi:MAG: ATP-binding cassette domain-containing protein [Magnetospiraceae bacterium]